jgi:peptidoglycan/xylan/chitin deacetylase (PgdA/CDA1 family)
LGTAGIAIATLAAGTFAIGHWAFGNGKSETAAAGSNPPAARIETSADFPTGSTSSAAAPAAPAAQAAQPAPAVPPRTISSLLSGGPARAASAAQPPAPACAKGPNALGVSRVAEIDTTGGPGFGFEQFKAYDFLSATEVVLTFDDGPWPGNTPAVLAALAAQCVKATFFPIGKHASWHPEILKQVGAQGHTIGSHTWSHVDLSKKPLQEAKDEIEAGVSAVTISLGRPIAPFFRFPGLRHTPELLAYAAQRNIGVFSADLDSFDFKTRKPESVVQSVMTKLKKNGKGIVLLHDFQKATATALPELLVQLKAGGYKIVHVRAKDTLATLPQYDAALQSIQSGQTADARPTEAVVRTVTDDAN